MRLTRFTFLQSKESKLDTTALQAPGRFLLMRDGLSVFQGDTQTRAQAKL